MNTEHLRQFLAVNSCNSFSYAAEILSIPQPTLSRHIRDLENAVGAPLFNRTTQKVELTEYGRTFLTYAQDMVRLENETIIKVQEKVEQNQKHLVIGSFSHPGYYGITSLISGFKKKNPECVPEIILKRSEFLFEMMDKEQCDFCFVRDAVGIDQRYEKVPYCMDEIVVVISQKHPLARQRTVRLEQLEHETFYFRRGVSTPLEQKFVGICQKAGYEPNVAEIIGDWTARILEEGTGVSMTMIGDAYDMCKGKNFTVLRLEPPEFFSVI